MYIPSLDANSIRCANRNHRHRAAFWRGFASSEDDWKHSTIPKADGSTRPISEPGDWGKDCGEYIAARIWKSFQPFQEVGFAPGTGSPVALEELQWHMSRNRDVVALDIKGAFNALSAKQVFDLMKAAGASTEVARIAVRSCCSEGRMMMGATLSPALFALAMYEVSQQILSAFGNQVGQVLAYADDLYLIPFEGVDVNRLKKQVRFLLWQVMKFKLSTGKSQWYRSHLGARALGASISTDGRIRPRPKMRSRIRGLQHHYDQLRGGDEFHSSSKHLRTDDDKLPNVHMALMGYRHWERSLRRVSRPSSSV